ncbi:transglutaminase-like cysteine peptidase [Oricola cellulosilytica]|uniref:Transglutaminase n=1 Tax=Oricola cellulosilytica TaxID=1429082 RepID=A0A4R0P9A1_9HYPH|nr:transglutaminase-like cysteine peptidase [Oricola cellulosilytica]TCD11317.1 hypothetical protein E0D97_17515 [Oricola cellulosilytica]
MRKLEHAAKHLRAAGLGLVMAGAAAGATAGEPDSRLAEGWGYRVAGVFSIAADTASPDHAIRRIALSRVPSPSAPPRSPVLSRSSTRSGIDDHAGSGSTGTAGSGFFGTVAIPFSGIASEASWLKVRNAGISASPCKGDPVCEARNGLSKATLRLAENGAFYEKLTAVNRYVNDAIRYESDHSIRGVEDYWASPAETMTLGRGDCEDFAILKYAMLRELGVPGRSLSLVILRDTARNLYHAVLAVSTNKGNFILDNVRDAVLPDVRIRNYQPLYSFSDGRSWIHGVQSDQKLAGAPRFVGDVSPGESAVLTTVEAPLPPSLISDLRPVFRP